MTYFDTLAQVRSLSRPSPVLTGGAQSYVHVKTEGGVDTAQFLAATEGLIKMFGTDSHSPL